MLPVVILHWNRPERCVGTVARFLDQEVPGGVRVVVVDNGSEPDAVAIVRKGLPVGVDLAGAAAQPRVRTRRQRRLPARPRQPGPGRRRLDRPRAARR